MFVYRVSITKFAKELTGMGAFLFGGRWNKVDTACIYASETRALAALEFLVNTGEHLPDNISIATIKIPDEKHLVLPIKQLPREWSNTEAPESTKHLGNTLLEQAEHLVIKIPSVIISEEYNYIINPAHRDMKKVSVVDVSPFSFDTRLRK